MNDDKNLPEPVEKGWKPISEGYRPKEVPPPSVKVNGGYQPTTSKAPSDAQPAQPPKDP